MTMIDDKRERSKGWIASVLALLFVFLLFTQYSCVRGPKPPITTREKAFVWVPVESLSIASDNLSVSSFLEALNKSIAYYRKVPGSRIYRFGQYNVSASQLVQAYTALNLYAVSHPSWHAISDYIHGHFIALKCVGYRGDGALLFTGYYEPQVRGSLKKNEHFTHPLYSLPDDLVHVDLKSFGLNLPYKRLTGRLAGNTVKPYFNRHEIDFENKLSGRGLELVWLEDLVECFFIHVQGSAEIILPDGHTMNVNYAGSNGQPYRSIGALLIDEGIIPKEKMSMNAIYEYLHEHPSEVERVLSHNPSYVFFRVVKNGPVGSLGVVLTPCRSVAADPKFFPPGALGFVRICKSADRKHCGGKEGFLFERLVLIQDRGGAIKGPGRIDYYWGKGRKAGEIAGSFKPWGEFYLMVPELPVFSKRSEP